MKSMRFSVQCANDIVQVIVVDHCDHNAMFHTTLCLQQHAIPREAHEKNARWIASANAHAREMSLWGGVCPHKKQLDSSASWDLFKSKEHLVTCSVRCVEPPTAYPRTGPVYRGCPAKTHWGDGPSSQHDGWS